MKPRVFVVQKQYRQEGVNLVPKFDLASAEKFGELHYLLSPTAAPFNSEAVIAELQQKLSGFRGNMDYLLLVGNPCFIGWTTAVAVKAGGGHLQLLQWSSRKMEYVCVEAHIAQESPAIAAAESISK